AEVENVNVPGSTVSIRKGRLKGGAATVYDTPGIHSIFSSNEDERVSRDILLSPGIQQERLGVILVADAKNLKHSIAIALQYAEYGLPMLFVVNMIDEATSRGIEIDYSRLAEELGLQVGKTIAHEGIGVADLVAILPSISASPQLLEYSSPVERFLCETENLLQPATISGRAIGLLLLCGDHGVEAYIECCFGGGMLSQLKDLAASYRAQEPAAFEVGLVNQYHREASRIAEAVQRVEPPSKNPFILTFGDWCTKLSTGIPIAFAILAAIYLFVGSFGATFLVDTINSSIFERLLIPWCEKLVAPIPSEFIRSMIMDPDFGILPSGVFLALGLVLPVIFCFYIAFGILDASGYLPRVSILLDRLFQRIGLNGKGVIPLLMGFSCVTMAILTTRVLATEKEKNIASFLLFLCVPCAPLVAVMLIILDKMPLSATITVFGVIFLQVLIAGFLADKILPGGRSPLILEIPAMRIPKPWPVLRMASRKSFFFMKEAVPVFVFASLVVFVFQRFGGLDILEKLFGPMIHQVLGLPEKSIQVFIKTMIRRESGGAELEHLAHAYTNLQLVVNMLVMVFLVPCLNAVMVLFKERGVRAASLIMVTVFFYAILLGSVVNYTCRVLGVTFT
ncbi:MAG: ferrous iron transporter B, partial [Desulfobulbaceae bacterium]|nr:ferrous iron transporter B [Desulfobulbaceae bacterium]